MEEAGWIARRPDPQDRRARVLSLTEKARPILEQMRALAAETRETALQGFSIETRERLIDALAQVRGNLSAREQTNDVGKRTGTLE